MMQLDLFLVRHGETSGAGTYLGGGSNPGLSPEGLRQAQALADLFAEIHLDAVYSSPLRRTRDMAEAVLRAAAPSGPKLELLEGLREIHFGDWEGLRYQDLDPSQQEQALAWARNPEKYGPPGGEAFGDFKRRVLESFRSIEKTHPQGRVLVLTHGGSLRVYLAQILGLSLDKFWQFSVTRGSLSLVKFFSSGPAVLDFLNLRLDQEWGSMLRFK